MEVHRFELQTLQQYDLYRFIRELFRIAGCPFKLFDCRKEDGKHWLIVKL